MCKFTNFLHPHLTIAIIYIYNDIEVLMWVNFEQNMCKIMPFFYFAPTGASAYI